MTYRFRIVVAQEDLWGNTEPRAVGYDEQASGVQYAEMLCNAITDEYPSAEVDVNYTASPGRTDIFPGTGDEFGSREDEVRQNIDMIAEKVWNSYPWEVELESNDDPQVPAADVKTHREF